MLLTVGVVFVADLGYAGFGVQLRLSEAARRLDAMRSHLEAGDLGLARSDLRAAADASAGAEAALEHPAIAVLGALPIVGDEADVIRRIVEAVDLVSRAAKPGLRAASILDYEHGRFGPDLYRNGRINLDLLSEAAPMMAEVEELLGEAENRLDASGRAILPPVRAALVEARARIEEASETAGGAVTLLRLLPRMVGGAGERRYLLAFQALGEARATGGVAGLFGVLKANDGKLELGRISSYSKLSGDVVDPPGVPSWYRRVYGLQGALREWPQANLSPNFPVDARIMLDRYAHTFDRPLDGVLAVDAVALSHLLEGTGPVSVPSFDKTVTAANAVEVLSKDAYLDFATRSEQNDFLGTLVRAVWKRIETGSVDVRALARGLGAATASQHLKLYAVNDADQADLKELGVDGSIEGFGPNLQLVFQNNYGVNKVDYYLHRTIRTRIEVGASGDIAVTTAVRLRNASPDGPKSDLLGGVDNNLPPGTNRMTLNFLLPKATSRPRLEIDGDKVVPVFDKDSGHPLLWKIVTVPPGEESVAKLSYVIAGAESLGSGGQLSFAFVPQPVLNDDKLDLSIVPPPGFVMSVNGGETAEQYVSEGELSVPQILEVELERS